MKSSLKLFFLLFLAAGSFTAFAASYTDGIEYFKAGQPDRAKILNVPLMMQERIKQNLIIIWER